MSYYAYAYNYNYNNELYHHGIKGQRWGIRRFQKKDGSLTDAGRKRYSDEVENAKSTMEESKSKLAEAKKEYNKANDNYILNSTKSNKQKLDESAKKFSEADKAYKDSKTDYKVAKIEAKGGFDSDAPKSKHQTMLEEKYRKQGYDEKQAAVMARDRVRAEKILVGAAALTVTACAAYAANKYIKERTDTYIKSGTELSRITNTDSARVHDMFYASTGRHDNKRYEGLLGGTRIAQHGEAYLKKLSVNKDIKVASQDKAAKIFEELYRSDPEFKKSVEEYVGQHFGGKNKVNTNKLSRRNIRKMYENFNSGLIHIRESGSGADQKFYKRLKEAGYGAIQDINDMKYSGYNAKNPLIIFDSSPNAFTMTSVSKLDRNKTIVNHTKELIKTSLESKAKENGAKIAALTTIGTSAAATKMYLEDREGSKSTTGKSSSGNTAGQKRYIEQYKKEHPNTKLSNAEIGKMYK